MSEDFINQFLDAMAANGLEPFSAADIKPTDGGWGRYRLADDKSGKKNGGYRLTVDSDCAVGQFKDYRIGEAHTWSSRANKKATPEEKAAYKEKITRLKAEEEKRRENEHNEAAEKARDTWKSAAPALDHPYLRKKCVQSHGAKMDQNGDLILPRYDFAGKLWGVQTIDTAGVKKYQYNAKTVGTMFPLTEKNEDKSVIYIAEGFATAASIREATGRMVIVAYDAGNLLATAQGARKKYPDAQIIICADNDQFSFKAPKAEAIKDVCKDDIGGDDRRWHDWRAEGYLHNTGIEKGKEAAHAVSGFVIWPEFKAEDLKNKPTDFNDYANLYGEFPLKEVLNRAGVQKLEDDLPFSEYNPDLIPAEPRIDWLSLVRWKDPDRGELHKNYSLHNAEVLITHKNPVGGCLCYDEFLNKMTVIKPLPWEDSPDFIVRELNSQDINRIRVWLEGSGIKLPKGCVKDVVELACMNNKINPAVEYLNSLKWDGVKRLDKWLQYYLGAEEQPAEYLARIGSCWLMASVRRILKPGTPFHHMLVLEGGQGALKSTAFATLATFGMDAPKEYFSDRLTFDMIDRHDFAPFADGNIILEFQELAGLGAKDINKVKQWITQTTDEYRKPHDPVPTKFPRKFVLGGTVNDAKYLYDPTGGRRFWPAKVGKIDIKALKKDREQLWAEAAHRARQGELWYIEPNDPVYKLMENEQSLRYEGDPWDDIVGEYIKNIHIVTMDAIFTDVLHLDRSRWDKNYRTRISNILIQNGFKNGTAWCKDTKKTRRGWVRQEPKTDLFEEDIPF